MALFRLKQAENPRQRVIMLITALVLVGLLAYVAATHSTKGPTSPFPPANRQPLEFAGGTAAATALKALPAGERPTKYGILDKLSKDDAKLRKAANLNNAREPLLAVLTWQQSQTAAALAAEAIGRDIWHYEKIMREPDRWRGQILHVYGMLTKKQIVEFPDNPEGLRKLYRLTLYDEDENLFYTVLTPALSQNTVVYEEGKKRGDPVACDAMFVMRFPYESDKGWKRTPLFVAPRVVRAVENRTPPQLIDPRQDPESVYQAMEPNQTVPALDYEWLNDKILAPPLDGKAKDGTVYKGYHIDIREMAGNLSEEKGALDHMFEYVYGLSDEELHEQAKNPEMTYVNIMKDNDEPTWMRGKAISFEGVLGTVQTMRFKNQPSGINRIHLITAGDTGYRNFRQFTWVLAVLNLPEGLRAGDRIAAEGIFYKRFPYRTAGGSWHWSPLIVCKAIHKGPPPGSPLMPEGITNQEIYTIVAIAGGVIIIIFFTLYRASQKDTDALERLRQRSRNKKFAYDQKKRREPLSTVSMPAPNGTQSDPLPPLTEDGMDLQTKSNETDTESTEQKEQPS